MIGELLAQKKSNDEEQQILSMKKSMDSPFVEKIRRFRPPSNFNQPQFKEFFEGRSGNPVEHIQQFQASMSLWSFSDELLCRTFPMTLTGKALTWFSQLESNSIRSFRMLSDAFFEQYKINLGIKKESSHLFLLHREPGESLFYFNRRFRQEVNEIGKVDEGFIIEAYKNAMDDDEFRIYNSLAVQPVETLKELYDRGNRYAKDEKEKKANLSRTTKRSGAKGHTKPKQQFDGSTKSKSHEGHNRKMRNEEDSHKIQEKQSFPS
ncbi:uncharacterized protein LOC113279503 [Papaver somniferum]|uniref:uncharacterized protein LOC113279503 n=1 Tax=Papaver somniferum TaxID=3469 RepID=UPI000E702086|nr:uncharacterized protein LOC113279503 [Papaver somniferum]